MLGVLRRVSAKWRALRLRIIETPQHESLEIGDDVVFNVPVRCGGSGTLRVGKGNGFGYHMAPRMGDGEILIQPRGTAMISIGDNNQFSNNVSIIANERVTIGDNCLIGDQVMITDSDFHEISPADRKLGPGAVKPVSIGNNVWLGSRVVVLKGVSIGDNTVVGAMSLVTSPLPADCVAAGVPARIIKSLEQRAD